MITKKPNNHVIDNEPFHNAADEVGFTSKKSIIDEAIGNLSKEASDNLVVDATQQVEIDSNTTINNYQKIAITSLKSSIASEVAARKAADAELEKKIKSGGTEGLDEEIAARKKGDKDTLSSAVTYTNAQDDIIKSSLNSQITRIDSNAKNITTLSGTVTTLNTKVTTLNNTMYYGQTGVMGLYGLNTAVNNATSGLTKEISDRKAADTNLESKITALTDDVNQVKTDVENANSAITEEVSARESADEVLQAEIDALSSASTDFNYISENIDNDLLSLGVGESEAAYVNIFGADGITLKNSGEKMKIVLSEEDGIVLSIEDRQIVLKPSEFIFKENGENIVLLSKDSFTYKKNDSAEEVATESDIEEALTSAQTYTDESSAILADEINIVTNRVTAETKARQDADTALENKITAETDVRIIADTSLANRINQEISARTDADTAIQNVLDTLLNTSGATTAIDTFHDVESFLQGITDTSSLTNLLAEQKTNIDAEIKEVSDKIDNVLEINDANELNGIILHSSVEGSTKKFKIAIDDNGILSATEI